MTGCTHSDESAAALVTEAFPVVACDIADPSGVASLLRFGPFDAVVHCASSGRGGVDQYRRVYQDGARLLLEILRPAHLVFTSSTSVYAQVAGEDVTESSAAEPDRETGRILRETEDFVVAHGGTAARLAGIYGPDRSVLLRKFFADEANIEADGTRWINQIHRDDAAAALVCILTRRAAGIFNVVDDRPLAQRDIYAWLAARFDRPLPPSGPIDPNRKRGWTHKRVLNAKLRGIGWVPRYASFFQAVDEDPTLHPFLSTPPRSA